MSPVRSVRGWLNFFVRWVLRIFAVVRFKTRDPETSSSMQSENGNSVRERLNRLFKKMTTFESWMKTVLFVCVVALSIDPLFFFIPVTDSHRFCFTLDKKLGVTVCVLRTLNDTYYVIHIVYHLMTGPFANVRHTIVVWKRHPIFYFIVDIVSVLPIPQVVVLVLIQRKQQAGSLVTKEILKWVIFCQYIPRSIRIYPIFHELTRVSGRIFETKWIGAALNLFLYLLPSHVIGAVWYLMAIETKARCWGEACSKTPGCNLKNLYCVRGRGGLFLNTSSCPLTDPDLITDDTVFNFGMYIDALKSRVVESRDLPRKLFHCFWWGLRNLSALGQNLKTSNSIEEFFFAILICISGLLLFAVLIGNVQKYLQSTTIRVDEMEEKKRDTEKWMSHRELPEDLKKRIRRYEGYKWKETRGIEDEAILRSLPKDIRLETKHYLYKETLISAHSLFRKMAENWILDALCDRVKPVFYSASSSIMKEGAPVEEMLIVTKGQLKGSTSSGETLDLGEGAICGDHLLSWVLDPHSSSRLPTSDRTIRTVSNVEGFIFLPDDLKSYSVELQSWAAASDENGEPK
ncbi:hypothetical protein AALP_AA4G253500 [Arabis alpina]|uniref:Cyclic nucleotide-binding domain-containing protein n=1 Tax=Arabis alpina TaxID=50452 RepID=A0A087H5K9_ARAAL|nr:hypothetical protein AALP_AA4G253500 [Arabis alpina]